MSISLRSVAFRYPAMQNDALQNITFDAAPGQLLLLVGHNGAGKSTLLRLLNAMLRPAEGTVLICGKSTEGRSTSALASEVAVTFQNPSDQIFASTVREEVAFGPRNLHRTNVDHLVESALHLCGLSAAGERHPYDLLLPERKLVTIASAIAMDTQVLAFDEPSAGLSQPERGRLIEALLHARSMDKTVLVISHDLGLFLPIADNIVALHRGRMLLCGDRATVETNIVSLRKTGVRLPYPQRILRAMQDER